ncbi:hypothetical protein BDP27DRAFT_1321236 [Rhodocollybia butyracea]|uniref:Uncharacterized protein n=1 Tax=Rhodocollybia butyracea TaxID=206335 RepID=A0A9P5Q1Q2_9AGAR|nr:hypothetical protein BDP27DRAFT_1321236 [Rhodocollybia butyracea]
MSAYAYVKTVMQGRYAMASHKFSWSLAICFKSFLFAMSSEDDPILWKLQFVGQSPLRRQNRLRWTRNTFIRFIYTTLTTVCSKIFGSLKAELNLGSGCVLRYPHHD